MFKNLHNALTNLMGSKLAATAVRTLKGAAAYEMAYAFAHISDPTNWMQWKGALLAGAILGVEKFASFQAGQQ